LINSIELSIGVTCVVSNVLWEMMQSYGMKMIVLSVYTVAVFNLY